jgi:aarF domain-containing kinase
MYTLTAQVDPKYAIVHECLPYMSRRLLTDNNPRMRAALKQLLYGNGTRLNIERLTKMFSAFSSFTTSPVGAPLATGPTFSAAASSTPQGQGGSTLGASSTWGRSGQSEGSLLAGLLTGGGNRDPIVTDSMKDMLKVIFSKEGSYAQEVGG